MYDPMYDLYKIGKTCNIKEREKAFISMVPEIKTILFCDKDIESFLHNEYKCKRKHGEWFALTADDVLDIIKFYDFKKF